MSEWAYRKCECGAHIHINTKCKCGGDPWHLKEQQQMKLKRLDEQIETLTAELNELQAIRDRVAQAV